MFNSSKNQVESNSFTHTVFSRLVYVYFDLTSANDISVVHSSCDEGLIQTISKRAKIGLLKSRFVQLHRSFYQLSIPT